MPSIGLEGNTGASTGDDEGVKFFAMYGVPVLYYRRASENVHIRACAFGVKHTGEYTCVQTGVYANFFLRGIVYGIYIEREGEGSDG